MEDIARIAGHSSTRTTEVVYRRELRPILTTGAEAMDRLSSLVSPNLGGGAVAGPNEAPAAHANLQAVDTGHARRSGRKEGIESRHPRCERDPQHGPIWLRVASCLHNLGNRTLQSARCSQMSADDGSPRLAPRPYEPPWARKLASVAEPERRARSLCQRGMPGAESQCVVEEPWHFARVSG